MGSIILFNPMRKLQISKIKIHPQLNLGKKIIDFKFNWISLLILTTFYVYGYFGYGSAKFTKIYLSVHFILILFILTLLLILSMLKHLDDFNDKLSLNRKDLIIPNYTIITAKLTVNFGIEIVNDNLSCITIEIFFHSITIHTFNFMDYKCSIEFTPVLFIVRPQGFEPRTF